MSFGKLVGTLRAQRRTQESPKAAKPPQSLSTRGFLSAQTMPGVEKHEEKIPYVWVVALTLLLCAAVLFVCSSYPPVLPG